MRIIETTDGKFINQEINNLKKGEDCMLGDYRFLVVKKKVYGKRTIFSNSNYVVIATEE
jgi:hypothetical protein